MTEFLSKQLVLQRSIERALENFKKIGRANLNAAKIRTRTTILKDNWNQYQDGHALALRTIPVKDQTTLAYFRDNHFEATEDIYQSSLEYMMECLEELEPAVSHNHSLEFSNARSELATLSQAHMPKINLPPFDGNYTEWESFRDRFSALIIQNTTLTDFARMHYLASCLKGRALDSITNIAITADNFPVAWNLLIARFENKRRLLASHFTTLLGASSVTKESAADLQLLVDKHSIAVASLKKLDRTPSDLWDDFLVHSLTQKLDSASRKAWNFKTSDAVSPPSHEELMHFLATRIRALEESASHLSSSKSTSASHVHVANASTSSLSACPLCKARHYLSACPKFTYQNPTQRRDTVKKFKQCFNCLSASHTAQECKSQYSCRSCSKRHHSLLHLESDSGSTVSESTKPHPVTDTTQKTVSANSIISLATSRARAQVLLATARVKVGTIAGRQIVVRALLDQGSEATFISEAFAQTLKAKRKRLSVTISAVGGAQVGRVRQAATLTLSPNDSDTPSVTATALILPSLSTYTPRRGSDLSSISHLTHLKWADPDPTSSDPIHLILGADIYSVILREGLQKGGVDQPIAQNSVFGWIISGPLVTNPSPESTSAHITVHHCTPLQSLNDEIKRFWETEEIPSSQGLSPQEERCEAHFIATHSRNSIGQYIVRLPFKSAPPLTIGQSRCSVERQFHSLSRRLNSQPTLRTEYQRFMQEYEELDNMRRAPANFESSNQRVYIPHHPVIRAESATTRLRVVFNASSVTSNGTSLNDHLLAGPKLQTELPEILLQWRQFRFVYIADIAKMYRQIRVDPRDLDYQRILWQPDLSAGPCEYQLLTVTYGMTCAPYLALRVLRCLTEDEGHKFPLAVPILRRNIYVDDVLFGNHELEALRQQRDHLISLLRCGHFELRKWASNSPALLEDIDPSDHGLACSKSIAPDEQVKVLGIVWHPSRDVFQFKIHLEVPAPQSKRTILLTIARLYDPLGWATPATVAAKIFMQHLWRSKIDWDTPIPASLLSRWQLLYANLSHLNEVAIDRWVRIQPQSKLELHGFADASTQTYAASVYLKTTSSSGDVHVSLLAGKSKVAPITPLTVPRLELSAAVLLSRLISFVRTALDLAFVHCICWTDSTIVLTWIRSHPSRWSTFVANRVGKIQASLPDAVWRHVPTSSNPADCASRGLHGHELISHALWWHGPLWLTSAPAAWPPEPNLAHNTPPLEEKLISHHVSEAAPQGDLSARYSSWTKLIRVTAYLLKFINACRRPKSNSIPNPLSTVVLSSDECASARTFWLKQIQADLFSADILSLLAGRPVPSRSPLAALSPFVDQAGLLRVGGRLRHAPLPFKTRHPILLAKHSITRLIITQVHLRTLHGGLQLTMRTLREEYWILRARNLIKSVIHNCLICVRERASVPTQLMGNLPAVRVSKPTRNFAHCGLDYAGPVKVRTSSGRGIKSRKAYIALFVCLTTRAIHLELVGDYSTSTFKSAFSRFCARRGLPTTIYSDNGTTFVGADREMTTAYRAALRDPNFQAQTANDSIVWHFIPPSAPHFGGIWEAEVRCVKHHLRRVVGSHTLSFEELTTVLCQIEACLNSRPIAPLSDTLDDYQFLTPGHFLIGSALTSPPEPSVLNLSENRLSRWQLVRHLTERFWAIWTTDYIHNLQQRNKWRRGEPPVELGRLVLLRNTQLPPCKWELGKIIRLHPGSDGLTRVVTVKTARSEFTRPIGKLCLLPVYSASND